jgi:hypothetical protein
MIISLRFLEVEKFVIFVQDLVNVLQHLDRDADGRLSFDEFAQGISRLGINLHDVELQVF